MYIPVFIGAVFLFIGTKVLIAQISLKKNSYTIVSGLVIGYKKKKSKRRGGGAYTFGGYSYAPIFEYYYDEKTRQVSHSLFTNSEDWLSKNFPKGKSVELLVYETDVDNAILNTAFGLNAQIIMSTIFIIIGIISLGVGIYIISI